MDRQPQGESPSRDPSEEPHDILAAEEFGIGSRDERYPADPSGIQEPHDVLAAEEFAMPAPGGVGAQTIPRRDLRAWIPLGVAALVFLALMRRRR
jgi:hypothetical protein